MSIINRIIDANMNRAKEGLRVCEEITRFILNHRTLTREFKKIRHNINTLSKKFFLPAALFKERESLSDVGRKIYANELKRKDYKDIFFANIQRVKESVRVLEEFAKLQDARGAVEFKKIRYYLYELEKRAAQKIAALRHSG